MKPVAIELVEDRTAQSRCDEGFLKVARLVLRTVYDDGSRSEPYPCDVVSRPGSDAVVAVLYELDAARHIRVLLRESLRPPIYLRREKAFVHADPGEYTSIAEVVAGLVETSDGPGLLGMQRRASAEADEEVGCVVPPEAFALVGGETFASPGTSDEKVYYCAGPADLAAASVGRGDGSAMEEHGVPVVLELRAAIEACRSGGVPDMKTEIALLRLADHLGYLPQLDCFVDDLPTELQGRYRSLGVERRSVEGA
jgi:ADP-ribose pyrophosphatase